MLSRGGKGMFSRLPNSLILQTYPSHNKKTCPLDTTRIAAIVFVGAPVLQSSGRKSFKSQPIGQRFTHFGGSFGLRMDPHLYRRDWKTFRRHSLSAASNTINWPVLHFRSPLHMASAIRAWRSHEVAIGLRAQPSAGRRLRIA